MTISLGCRSFFKGPLRRFFVLICLLLLLSSASAFVTPMTSSSVANHLIPSQVVSSKTGLKKGLNKQNGSKTKKNAHPVVERSGTLLVPAQVSVSSSVRQKQHSSHNKNGTKGKNYASQSKEPSIKPGNMGTKASSESPSNNGTAKSVSSKNGQPKGRRKGNPQTNANGKKNGKSDRTPKFGNLPDIFWGSIPMDHLRMHPKFEPLPLPEELPKLTNLEDVRYIRQDSWQWDVLHDGRCTTSQAVAALGFLEPEAGRILGVPLSWQRRSVGAYHRLQQPALRTLEEMNEALLPDNTPTGNNKTAELKAKLSKELWRETKKKSSSPMFAATYLHPLSNTQKKKRKHFSMTQSQNGMGIRMLWGNAQEATSVLTALNYFIQQNPNVVVKEIGMCGAGLALNQTDGNSPSSLLIGATPDAVIEYPDGSIEALEVKNHCPFVLSHARANKGAKQFTIREMPFQTPYIFPLYVPQLQLEMNCLGPECKSAIMVRQTATTGALVLRMYRNQEWIDEMLYWLNRFQQDFVEREVEPQSNFFFTSEIDGPRYRKFLDWTKDMANNVELVARIPHKSIQRAHFDHPIFLD